MIPSDFAVHRSSTGSRDSGDDEEGFSFSSVGKTPRKSNANAASSRRFRCLSTIGLPKRPDTKFRKQDISGQLRSSISRKCNQRQSGSLFNGISREAVLSAKRGNNSLKIYDPGSPDVSCLGRIKLKQKDGKGLRSKLKSLTTDRREDRPPPQTLTQTQTQRFSWLKKWFTCRKKVDDSHRAVPAAAVESSGFDSNRENNVEIERSGKSGASCPPTLAQMKRFTSQREPPALSDFSADDVAASDSETGEKAVEEHGGVKKVVEEDKGVQKLEQGQIADIVGVYHDMDYGVCIAYPPPLEVNLWKRRSVAPPVALDLKPRQLGIDMRRPMTV